MSPMGPTTTSTIVDIDNSKQQPRSNKSANAARPSCTHVEMDRAYGNGLCDVCKMPADLDFLYSCLADTNADTTGLSGSGGKSGGSREPTAASKKLQKTPLQKRAFMHASVEFLIAFMKRLGMHQSVVQAAEEGHYTREQICRLVAQKVEVKDSIKEIYAKRDALQGKSTSGTNLLADRITALGNTSQRSMAGNTTLAQRRANWQHSEAERAVSKALNPCSFNVCHTCRPLCRDRSYASFEAILGGDLHLSGVVDPRFMPIQPAHVIRNLGTRPNPPPKPSPIPDLASIHPEGDESDLEHGESSSGSSSSSYDLSGLYMSQSPRSDPKIPGEHGQTTKMRPHSLNMQTPKLLVPARAATISGKPSSAGFHDALAKDLQSMIHRAYREAQLTGMDSASGMDKRTLGRLVNLYKRKHGQIFDHALWRAMTESLLAEASRIPLPDDNDDIEDETAAGDLRDLKVRVSMLRNMPVEKFSTMFGLLELDNSKIGEHFAQPEQKEKSSGTTHVAYSSRVRSVEELRSAEHVHGGLAVTEEALQTGSPDLITSV